jgi:hypothetical protein
VFQALAPAFGFLIFAAPLPLWRLGVRHYTSTGSRDGHAYELQCAVAALGTYDARTTMQTGPQIDRP